MMPTADSRPLADVFFPSNWELAPKVLEELESKLHTPEFAHLLAARVRRAIWSRMFGRIVDFLPMALGNDVARDIFIKIWNGNRLFDKYFNPDDYDPTKVTEVTLSKHNLKSTHQPSVELKLDGETIMTIKLDVEVTFEIEGAIVTVQNGRIMSLKVGNCQARGVVSYQDLTLADPKTKKFDLAKKVSFGDGIPILPG